MAEGIEKAARAFDAVVQAKPDKAPARPKSQTADGPQDSLFPNLGELGKDSEAIAGGDHDLEEDPIYGKTEKDKTDPRHPREREKPDREGDDDEPDGDDTDDSEESDDEAGDADGDEEEKEEDDTDVSDLDPATLKKKIEVTVDGEAVEVTVKEALEGYVRTETFHRRMNQLDEAKKIIRRAANDAVQNYEYSMNVAKQMEAHMEQMIPKEPDWDAEFQKDPAKARDLQRYYEKANTFRASLKASMDEAAKKQVESSHTQLAAFAEEEGQKFESMNRKNWSDPKKKAKDLLSMRKTALGQGFTEEELSQVYDSRMLMVLLKASKFDRMMAARPKPVVRQQTKPIPPGAGSARSRTAQRGADSAMKRLNRTGSLEDAAVVFDQLIARK